MGTLKMKIVVVLVFFVVGVVRSSAQQTGRLSGLVVDSTNQRTLPGATVLLEGTDFATSSNVDGRFVLTDIPVGTYILKVTFVGFLDFSQEITIQTDQVTTVRVEMSPRVFEAGEVVVTGYLEGKERALARERNALSIKNVVSREEMENFPDDNVAEVLQRVPGAAIRRSAGEGQFVLLRGTEPRLTKVTINGLNMSSAEEEDRVVPLDIIQSDQLAAVEVSKTLTPDMDGSSIGGTVNLETKTAFDYARDRNFSWSYGGGFHSKSQDLQNTGDFSWSHRIGKDNRLGYTVNASWQRTQRITQVIEAEWDEAVAKGGQELGFMPLERTLANNFRKRDRFGTSASIEYYPFPGKDDKFFVNGIWNKRNARRRRDRLESEVEGEFEIDDGEEFGFIDENTALGTEWVRSLQQNKEERTQYTVSGGGINTFDWFTLEYQAAFSLAKTVKELPFAQVGPEFKVEGVEAEIIADEENPKFLIDDSILLDPEQWELDEISFRNQDVPNKNYIGQVDISIPYRLKGTDGIFKFGGKSQLQSKDRFDNRFEFELAEGDMTLAPFADDFVSKRSFMEDRFKFGPGINPGKFRNFFFENMENPDVLEREQKIDDNSGLGGQFEGSEDILSWYVMSTNSFGKFRTVIGVRHEFTDQEYTGRIARFDDEGDFVGIESVTADPGFNNVLPMANVKYSLNNSTNIRLGITQSIARADFFDLVPFEWIFPEDNEIVRGNENLNPTRSTNFDLVFEHFYQNVGKVSISLFYKDINDPIFDATFIEQGGNFDGFEVESVLNGGEANVKGFEFSWQQQLAFLPGDFLKRFSIFTNYTYTDSNAEIPNREEEFFPGQSDNTANISLNYTYGGLSLVAALNFNDSFVDEVGESAKFDEVRGSSTQFDFTARYQITRRFQIFMQAINLNNQAEKDFQGLNSKLVREREEVGIQSFMGLKFDL